MNTYAYIDTKEEYQKAINEIKKSKLLAIDLECENNLHHFGVYISLIQISTEKKDYILDILKLKKVPELIEIFNNKGVKKIFHDIGFDFRILNHQFNCVPQNFFDTQVAAALLGKKSIGLGSLLEEYFEIKKESKFQKADWTKRPLSKGMLDYASKDTAHLIKLYKTLIKDLKEKKRLSWAEEEMDYLATKDFTLREQQFGDLKGLKNLDDKERGILKELFEARQKVAQEVDEPVHHVLSTKRLFDFAQRPPKSWKKIRKAHPIIYKKAVLFEHAVQEGQVHPIKMERKEIKRHTPEEKQIFQKLQDTQRKIAEKLNLAGHLIISKDQMINLIAKKDEKVLRKWQISLLKKESPKLLNLVQ